MADVFLSSSSSILAAKNERTDIVEKSAWFVSSTPAQVLLSLQHVFSPLSGVTGSMMSWSILQVLLRIVYFSLVAWLRWHISFCVTFWGIVDYSVDTDIDVIMHQSIETPTPPFLGPRSRIVGKWTLYWTKLWPKGVGLFPTIEVTFSNSLIIHQVKTKEIITLTLVWKRILISIYFYVCISSFTP